MFFIRGKRRTRCKWKSMLLSFFIRYFLSYWLSAWKHCEKLCDKMGIRIFLQELFLVFVIAEKGNLNFMDFQARRIFVLLTLISYKSHPNEFCPLSKHVNIPSLEGFGLIEQKLKSSWCTDVFGLWGFFPVLEHCLTVFLWPLAGIPSVFFLFLTGDTRTGENVFNTCHNSSVATEAVWPPY